MQDLIAPKLFISTCLERSNFHVLFLIVYPIRLAADTAKVVNDRPKECQQSLISRKECVPLFTHSGLYRLPLTVEKRGPMITGCMSFDVFGERNGIGRIPSLVSLQQPTAPVATAWWKISALT